MNHNGFVYNWLLLVRSSIGQILAFMRRGSARCAGVRVGRVAIVAQSVHDDSSFSVVGVAGRERGVEGWSEFVKKGPPLPFLFLYNALQGSFSSSFHKEIAVAR